MLRCLILFLLCCAFATIHAVEHSPCVIFSPPKCGTHLVAKAVSLICQEQAVYYIGGRNAPNQLASTTEGAVAQVDAEAAMHHVFVAHFFTAEMLSALSQRGYRVIFTVRDPRDALVSFSNWLREGQWSHIEASKIANQDLQIRELITGSLFEWRFVHYILEFEETLKQSHVPRDRIFYAYFEQFVGPNGGGCTYEQQTAAVAELANFLEVPLTIEQIEGIAQKLFGGTPTFRNGQVGSWKYYFSESNKRLFKRYYNRLLIRLGYESGRDW